MQPNPSDCAISAGKFPSQSNRELNRSCKEGDSLIRGKQGSSPHCGYHGDKWQPLEFAGALYVQSLTDKNKSAALLREAAGLVDGLPPTLRALHDVRLWRDLIQQARQGAAEPAPPARQRSAG